MHGDEVRVLQFGECLAFPNGFGAIQNLQGNVAIQPVARVIDIAERAVAEFLDDLKLSPLLSRLQRLRDGSRRLQQGRFVRNPPS